MSRYLLILLALFGLSDDGSRSGRRGNALYQQEAYPEASEAYRAGLAALERSEPGPVSSGLLNNLGAALYRQDTFDEALNAFGASAELAGSPADVSRGTYNAGNAAFRSQQLDQSLAQYRRALLADPKNEDARFNYEFVRRRLQEQEQQSQDPQEDQEQQDQEQQNQDQQGDQDQEQQDQEQQQEQPQQQDEQGEEGQPQDSDQSQPRDPEQLSPQEAEQMLEALQNEEEQLLRQVMKMKSRPRRVEKDW